MAQNDIDLNQIKRNAEIHKELGNKHFKSGNTDQSIKCYSEAIRLFPMNPIFYTNRSIAYLKKGLPLEAESDCDYALNLDHNSIKALYRRGMARKQLFRYKLSSDDFKQVLNLDPNNREAKQELQSIQRLIDTKSVVNIKPIDKKTEFQSNKSLIKMNIIDTNVIKISEIESKLPKNIPQNYYQLECDWRQLRENQSKHLRLKYLETIGSNRIQTLLTSTLEPQMMSELLDTICESNDFNLIYCVLKQMSKTPRFSTLVLFMSDSDQKVFNVIIDKLKKNQFNSNLIEDIESNYK